MKRKQNILGQIAVQSYQQRQRKGLRMNGNENQNLDEVKAASYLGLKSRQTLANWRYLRKGPAYCLVGRRIIYRREDLDSYLQSRRIDPESEGYH